MKILQLSKKFPYPLKDGESIAIQNLSKSLYESGAEVSLLAMNTSRHFYPYSKMPGALNHYSLVKTVKVDNRLHWWQALKHLLTDESYHIGRFISSDYSNTLKELLQKHSFDIVQLETLYLAPYIPIIRKYSKALVCMRAHNVEYEIWERVATNTPLYPKRWYLQLLAEQLKRFETNQLKDYDLLAAITQRDLEHFRTLGFMGSEVVIPIGLDPGEYSAESWDSLPSKQLSFIGSLDWAPNLEGLNWFLKEVWPLLRSHFPDMELHIAGRNPPPRLSRLVMPGVQVHGEVPCAKTFLKKYPVMVAPLLSGSGMRAKILEGMALGRVVLTTSLGAEGIEARDGEHFFLTDTPDAYLQVLKNGFEQPDQWRQIAKRAQVLVHQHYDRRKAAQQLLKLYEHTSISIA